MQPVELIQHEAGAEASSSPFTQVLIDLDRFPSENLGRFVQVSVVMEVVHSDFESMAG